eukprot:m.239335 g.239335  ORF g.239335 m.239335 type:complete len:50 (-) comp16066_c3_seq2:280-429(-)
MLTLGDEAGEKMILADENDTDAQIYLMTKSWMIERFDKLDGEYKILDVW